MSKTKLNILYERYPKMFSDLNWGFECQDGWALLLECLADYLQWEIDHNNRSQIVASQIKEKFGCYDKETEVLTDNGWKLFKQVSFNDKIATLNDKYIEYHTPTDIISYNYNGKMYKLKTRGVDLLVTPNHNLYVAKGSHYNGKYTPCKRINYKFELATPKKYFNKNKCFNKAGIWKGYTQKYFTLPKYSRIDSINRCHIKNEKKFLMSDWVKFLGFYIAEGCTIKPGNTISIACCNTDNGKTKKIVTELITNLGYKIKITQKDKSACVYRIYDTQLGKWLLDNCGHLAQNKKVPNFIKDLTPKYIQMFLNYLYIGDGYKSKTAHTLTTVSKTLANDVQELIFKSGKTSTLRKREFIYNKTFKNGRIIKSNFPSYEINWLQKSNLHNTQNKGMAKSSFEGFINYSGSVHCVTVPNNTIYIRRNGVPVWCGNSLRFYYYGGDNVLDGAIRFAELLSGHICESCGKFDNTVKKEAIRGWVKTLCDDCRKERVNEA